MREIKEIKVEWCRNFIKAFFEKHVSEGGGAYTKCLLDAAERAGLYKRGTCVMPMNKALAEFTKIEIVTDEKGNCLYAVFKLA